MSVVIQNYLHLLDSQRESTLSALEGITDSQLWQRPAPTGKAIQTMIAIRKVEPTHVEDQPLSLPNWI